MIGAICIFCVVAICMGSIVNQKKVDRENQEIKEQIEKADRNIEEFKRIYPEWFKENGYYVDKFIRHYYHDYCGTDKFVCDKCYEDGLIPTEIYLKLKQLARW